MNHHGIDKSQSSRRRLIRGADGRLRPAAAGSDIGDIWAEQKRIRLAEAIQEQQRKAEKKKSRQGGAKEFVFNIDFFNLNPTKLAKSVKLPKVRGKTLAAGLIIAVVVAGLGTAGLNFFNTNNEEGKGAGAGVLSSEDLKAQQPEFETIVPKGKSIEDLGGWARVSPPEKDPVFAYVDVVNGVQLNVSQQPLPESFKPDVAGKVAELAQQFSANQRLTTDGLTVYVGTSSKGPQSVILTKNGLLVLIRSASKLTDEQWVEYAQSLQ